MVVKLSWEFDIQRWILLLLFQTSFSGQYVHIVVPKGMIFLLQI